MEMMVVQKQEGKEECLERWLVLADKILLGRSVEDQDFLEICPNGGCSSNRSTLFRQLRPVGIVLEGEVGR